MLPARNGCHLAEEIFAETPVRSSTNGLVHTGVGSCVSGGDEWFVFVPTASGVVSISTEFPETTFPSGLGVYSSCSDTYSDGCDYRYDTGGVK